MPVYLVQTQQYGTLRKSADTIADARAWAKKALDIGPHAVSREVTYRRCDWCGGTQSLCDCRPRRRKEV